MKCLQQNTRHWYSLSCRHSWKRHHTPQNCLTGRASTTAPAWHSWLNFWQCLVHEQSGWCLPRLISGHCGDRPRARIWLTTAVRWAISSRMSSSASAATPLETVALLQPANVHRLHDTCFVAMPWYNSDSHSHARDGKLICQIQGAELGCRACAAMQNGAF